MTGTMSGRGGRVGGALAVALAAGLAGTANADVKSWNTGNGSWWAAGNWTPAGVPGHLDTIRIGNLPGVQNSTVMMGPGAGSGYAQLEVSSGMTLDLNGSELVSFGDAWITGAGTRLIAWPQAGLNASDFMGTLRLGTGATLDLRNDVSVAVFGDSWSTGTIVGRGQFKISSTEPFRNDGTIRPSNNGGLRVLQGEINSQYPIDLDGSGGNGHLQLDTPFAQLLIEAAQLTDTFSGTVTMAPGSLLTMTLGAAWAADSGALVDVSGANNPAAASQIAGSAWTLSGALEVGGDQGHLRVLAPLTVLPGAAVEVGATDWLELDGATSVEGGAFTVLQGGKLEFDGATTMEGGAFATFSEEIAGGFVAFNGPTHWRGTVTINGAARQNGAATVTTEAVINADLFDFSGEDDETVWTIGGPLVINAKSTRTNPLDFFSGVMTIGGGLTSKLTMNLAGGTQTAWAMDGVMNLTGSPLLFAPRLAGARIVQSGAINIADAKIEIGADMSALQWGWFNFAAAGSQLRMRGKTTVSGSAFTGQGTFINGVGGEMWLLDGLSLGQVGLLNQGTLYIRGEIDGPLPGTVTVHRFTNDTQGVWRVGIGGPLPGTQHDVLMVSGGTATLGGTLEVELTDLGSGTFLPVVGDQFRILRAPAGVGGAFANSPATWVSGSRYDWEVVHEPTSVLLRLARIVPPCYANCDGSTTPPVLNVNDFICFQNKFAGGSTYANCDGSTVPPVLNVNDFVCFQTRYAQGCP